MNDVTKRSASDVDSVTSLMQSLYQRAEAALGQRVGQSPEQFAALSPAQAQRMLHDLQVHQVELEMQNEELRRQQVKLDESLARYVDFYDLAPVGYCTVTEEGLIKESNLTTSKLLNVPRSELLKQPITRFIFNDDQDTYYKHLRKLIEAEGPLSVELRLLKRDGAPFWAHLEVAKVKEGEGGSEMRLVIKDITERKTVEESLRASEAQYRSLAEWTPESIIIHGEGKMLFVNPAAIKMLGATCASDLVGKPILELIHPDFRKIVSQRLDKNAKPGGKSLMQEQKLFKRDGSVIDVEVQGMQVNFNGKPAVHASMRDITERKKLEVERNRLLAIISEAPDFISIADMQGHLKYLNAAGDQAATANLTMAVNVTARQFQQGDFVEQLIAVLERTGANPLQLKLELTESVLITAVESVIVKMKLLKDKGISFSLDDFGTGYSSLSDLKRLPLSQLKIAQELVRDILVDPDDMGIVRMVIALADSMGLTVIAEGVETKAQRDFLEMLGCTRYQGFLFCSPVPIEEFEVFLKRI